MNIRTNPSWINQELFKYEKLADVPQEVFEEINSNLDRLCKPNPLVSIVIPAWNEEVNIIRCVYTLSKSITQFNFEIVVVNNNSTDRTAETLSKLHIRSSLQPIQGCGISRQMGQEIATGKYILLGDADCLYPSVWIQKMTEVLQEEGVVCVYGRYSFLGNPKQPRWHFFIYETFKDLVAEIRHIKRPHLNAYGMSMGYIRELGLKIGFVERHIRGEDGRMCFDLMQHGKVKQVRARSARVWTGSRTLDQEGSVWKAFFNRVKKEIARAPFYFIKQKPHDTKTSSNDEPSLMDVFKKTKSE
jgi:glycosyltransferase involved in cell wall biosynthesis